MSLSRAYQLARAGEQEAIVNRCTAIEGVDQAFVARIAKVPESTVSEWKSGKAQMEVWHIQRLVEAFGFDVLGVAPRFGRVDPQRELRASLREASALLDDVADDMADGVMDDGDDHARRADALLLNLAGLPDAFRAFRERR